MACVTSEPPRSPKDCRKVLAALDRINPVIALMLEFSALTGLRYSDVSKLTFKQVKINGQWRDRLAVVQQKPYNKRISGGMAPAKARKLSTVIVSFNEQCKDLLDDAEYLNPNGTLLFESSRIPGKPFTAQYTNRLLKRVAVELKLNYALSSHSFRKAFALFIIDNGARIHQVRDSLGQSSLASTDKYLKTFIDDAAALSRKISF